MAAARKRTAKKKPPIRKAARRRKPPVKKAKSRPKPAVAIPARKAPRRPDPVDESSDESFPASDPPSWTPVTGEEG